MAAVVLMLLLQLLELLLMAGCSVGPLPARPAGAGPGRTVRLVVDVLFWAVLVQAIMSWFNPDYRQPLVRLLQQLTEPVLSPARRLLPPISGLDLSPLLVIIALQLSKILLVAR